MNFDHVYIIAEAGVNHDGKVEQARKLIDKAADAGADAVKFQLFKTDEIVNKDSPLADYQKEGGEENQYEMVKRLELPQEDFRDLKAYAEEKGLDFITTPFDAESAQFLADLQVKVMKIPSGEITNLPFLEKVAALHIPSIISTGMSTIEEIEDAVTPFTKEKTPFVLLHCVSSYPTPVEEVNLNAMETLRKKFDVPVGFSDHTKGSEIPIAAVALGASIIEKHFTLDRSLPGPDHRSSLEPHELKHLVESIRNVEKSLGTGEKVCQPCEENTREIARRSIQLTQDAKKGDAITEDMLAIKRPGTGLAPNQLQNVLGKSLTEDLSAGTVLQEEHLQ